MEQSIIDSYVGKFEKLVGSYLCVQQAYEIDIKKNHRDDPTCGEVWKTGAYIGVLIFFLRILTEEEREISQMVLDRIQAENGSDAMVNTSKYIDAAVEVLESLDYHIPEDESS